MPSHYVVEDLEFETSDKRCIVDELTTAIVGILRIFEEAAAQELKSINIYDRRMMQPTALR